MFKNIITTVTSYARAHKLITGLISAGIVVSGYGTFALFGGSAAQAQYVLTAVERGTLIVSVSGTGQVSASDQIDVKPKTSGDILYVTAKVGQEVRTGTLLAQLDTTDAQRAVRDAQIALESAQITLEKLELNQQTNIPELQDDLAHAQDDLAQTYQDGYNKVADAFLTMPDILAGIYDVLYDNTVGSANQENSGAYQDIVYSSTRPMVYTMVHRALTDYGAAEQLHINTLNAYQSSSINDTPEEITALMDSTLQTAKAMVQAARDEQNLLDTVESDLRRQNKSVPKAIAQYQDDIGSFISALNSIISGVTNLQNSIASDTRTIAAAQRDLTNAAMTDPLDLKSQENTVEQRRAALTDAQAALANCSIRAPFAGVVTDVSVKKGDSASAGTTIATLVTKQRIAELSLNEVDAANIKVGQKATITFDAVEELTISGTVIEVDAVGTASQGVVTYGAKIGFDIQDDRVKPGMSASAAIITEAKQNALLVPSSAIKTRGSVSYVEMPTDAAAAGELLANVTNAATGIALPSAPSQQIVELGASNDTMTEITSGLTEGDLIVTRTVTNTGTTTTNSSQSRNSGNMPAGGGIRMMF